MIGAEVVQDRSEDGVAFLADLLCPRSFHLVDRVEDAFGRAVTSGGSTHDDGPDVVGAYEELPHALAHGDATPDNFRESGSGDIVAIDASYVSPAPLGSDLSQLLVGRIESGAATADEFQSITTTILPAYLDGLAREGTHANPDAVEAGWAIALAVRSVFSALNLDHRADLDQTDRDELLARRALACRFGLDLALRVAHRIA